jgi:hypothetical protein
MQSPRNTSNKLMRQNSKLGGKPEYTIISEATGGDAPQDPFKTLRVMKIKKKDVAENINR